MRTKSVMVAALLLLSAGARAQEPKATPAATATAAATGDGQIDVTKTTPASIPDIPLTNQVDFAIRGTAYADGSDQARFQRYRDLRDGGTIDRFRLFKDTNEYRVSLQ